jgi:hypothetical protein
VTLLGLFKRRRPEPPEPEPKTGAGAEHIVTDLGGGKYLHSFKSLPQTDAQRQRDEDAAIAGFDQSLAPTPRYPVVAPRPSIFNTSPDPQRFPH